MISKIISSGILIIGFSVAILLMISTGIYALQNPGLTQTQVFIDRWPYMVAAVVLFYVTMLAWREE
jgi:hypothetical protein